MEWVDALRGLVLGVVQGLTEFLPVSSSGHLILAPKIFGWEDQGLAFDTVLHLGTLAALGWFFGSELAMLGRRTRDAATRSETVAFLAKLVLATVPAVIVALLFGDWIEQHTRNAWLVAFDLAIFGVLLFAADRKAGAAKGKDAYVDISWMHAFLLGCAQSVALLPGTSRSGITITAALFLGFSRPAAARFSFLLALPVTFLAGVNGLWKLIDSPAAVSWPALAAGFAAAAISGAFAIRFLLGYVSKHRYDVFVAYRIALALAVLFLAL